MVVVVVVLVVVAGGQRVLVFKDRGGWEGGISLEYPERQGAPQRWARTGGCGVDSRSSSRSDVVEDYSV